MTSNPAPPSTGAATGVSTRASLRERAAVHALSAVTAALLVATPLAAVPVMGGLIAVCLVLVVLDGWPSSRRVALASAAFALAFLLMSALASRGALDRALHWERAFQVAGCFAAAPVVVSGGRVLGRRLPFGSVIGIVAGWLVAAAAVMALELARPGLKAALFGRLGADIDPLKLNRPAEFLAALLVVVLAAAVRSRRPVAAGAIVLGALALWILSSSETARLLLLVGLPLAVLPPAVQRLSAVLAVLGVATLGLLAATSFYSWVSDEAARLALFSFRPETFAVRLEIWERVAAEAVARPWGSGLEATRQLVAAGVDFSGAVYRDAVLWHPHNLGLQLVLDLGWVGFAAAIVASGLLLRRILGGRGGGSGLLGVALVAALLHSLFAHSVWHITPMAASLSLAFLASWIAASWKDVRGT